MTTTTFRSMAFRSLHNARVYRHMALLAYLLKNDVQTKKCLVSAHEHLRAAAKFLSESAPELPA